MPISTTRFAPSERHKRWQNSALIGSSATITVPVHIAGAIDTRGVQFWFMGVRAMTAIIPPLIIALIAQRYIVRGLTLGAVRG